MGKIPVEQLAKMMGIAQQDLVFKLKSIGVRVDEKDPHIDTEIVQAIVQGKTARTAEEVILRDKEGKGDGAAAKRRVPPRRMPTGPMRPGRRRPLDDPKVEPRIRTLPASETTQAGHTGSASSRRAAAAAVDHGRRTGVGHRGPSPRTRRSATPPPEVDKGRWARLSPSRARPRTRSPGTTGRASLQEGCCRLASCRFRSRLPRSPFTLVGRV